MSLLKYRAVLTCALLVSAASVLAQTAVTPASSNSNPTVVPAVPRSPNIVRAQSPSAPAAVNRDVQLARSGSESGGGGTYVLRNGEYVISDRYYESMGEFSPTPVRQVRFSQLPPAVVRAAEHMIEFMGKLGVDGVDVRSDSYLLVPKGLENHGMCNVYTPNLSNSTEAQVRYGCTNGNITFLYVDVMGRASLRQQAYALLHERLWTRPAATQQDVVNIVDGVMTLEEAFVEQKSNPHAPISAEVFRKLDALYSSARKLGLRVNQFASYPRTPNGGWIQPNCLHPDSRDYLVGIGARVACNRPAVRQAKLQNVVIVDSEVIDAGSISNTTIEGSTLYNHSPDAKFNPYGSGSLIERELRACFRCVSIPSPILDGAQIRNTKIFGSLTTFGAGVLLDNTVIESRSSITISGGSKLKNVRIGGEYESAQRVEIGANVELTDFTLELAAFPSGYYNYEVPASLHLLQWDFMRPLISVLSDTQIHGANFESSLTNARAGLFGDDINLSFSNQASALSRSNRVTTEDASGRSFSYRAWGCYRITRNP